MYLLDAPIVFELRKAASGHAEPGLTDWATGVARERLFLSALTLLELETHAIRTERRDKAEGGALRNWIDGHVMRAFDGRVLAIDAAVVRRRGQIAIADSRDALLAATALEHSLTLVTRNGAAFKGARVKTFDPRGYRAAAADEELDWRSAARTGPFWLKNLFVRS
ncbi:PIN domain-containing protein [Sphingomonas sp. M1-B02]|uniref:PIN domain-containing protein n=1 Tax=Sphingomonas sp. M1-B02 TaxID=3114300 RepID=UPI00223EA052|nr:PIN domain-containing protein [Sphingomonas sp. S6-11]UZK66259.1 PIN domain-containing protein [Sphingomonas sp. S6-11]